MRLIKLPNAHNFRDLGGYPTKDGRVTRRGLVYRSDALCKLTEEDYAILRPLNIQSVFDLRESIEHTLDGTDQVWAGCRVIHVPTSIGVSEVLRNKQYQPGVHTLRFFYVDSFERRKAYHAELFKQVADPVNQPVVFHCTAGKDRTGIFAALLLRLAGVADEDIIADYAETARHRSPQAMVNAATRDFFHQLGMDDASIDDLFDSHPDNIRALLTHLDEVYGTAENYLMQGGVTAAKIEQFKADFVE